MTSQRALTHQFILLTHQFILLTHPYQSYLLEQLGVWRHYEQWLPAVRRYMTLLRQPLETRLKNEVKIGKWDQMTTYGLLEHSEKIHRKLNNFIRWVDYNKY